MMKKIKPMIIATAFILTAGCATTQNTNEVANRSSCHGEKAQEQSVKLDMIRQLANDGQFYSALAHLEATGLDSPSARLLKAESLRRTGNHNAAMKAYDDVIKSCISAYGHLGKGKILAEQGRLEDARRQMEIARGQMPTDANIRNDLGFMLLIAGDYTLAQREFMTAIELQNEHIIARRNLILSLVLSGELDMAWRLAQQHGINLDEYRDLLERSASFKRQRVAGSASSTINTNYDKPILERRGGTL